MNTSKKILAIMAAAVVASCIALAGFAATDVTEFEAELDTDDGVAHYDVEFKHGGMEYDYDVNATTGEILKFDNEIDD